jgi:anti-sigma regulatory factor (Ser/Thr protein kinase)
MLSVELVMASDVLDMLPVVVTTPGTVVSLPGVVASLLEPQADSPLKMPTETIAGRIKRFIMGVPILYLGCLLDTRGGWIQYMALAQKKASDVRQRGHLPVGLSTQTATTAPQAFNRMELGVEPGMSTARRTTPKDGTSCGTYRVGRPPPSTQWSRRILNGESLVSARRQARQFLVQQAFSTKLSDDIVLTMSELLSNALSGSPAGRAVTAEIDCRRAHLVELTVVNASWDEVSSRMALTSMEMPGADGDHGRGLPLVATLATRLTIDSRPGSVLVRADFAH